MQVAITTSLKKLNRSCIDFCNAGRRSAASQSGQTPSRGAGVVTKRSSQACPSVAPIEGITTTTGTHPALTRLWQAYTRSLERRPLLTKMTAAALIFFSSDTAAQRIMDPEGPEGSWDASRSASGAAFGVFSSGFLHFWWRYLEATVGRFVPSERSRIANTAAKVLIDQGVGAPLYVYCYYVVTNTLQRIVAERQRPALEILEETEARARLMLWPTMLQHWKLWPAVHSINFYFIPLQHRVLVQNTVLVGWSGYLSHLNKTGLPKNDGKLMTPKEEIETAIQRRNTVLASTNS